MRNLLDVETQTGFYFWLLLILLTAVSLRLYQLDSIPPGFTHDEADHGITAVAILDGAREIYFTVGYGREPLFDYATAGAMALLGQHGWVLRGTAVFFSLILIGGMTTWTRLAFNNRIALLTAAGLAVGFWPLMAARQGLRSIVLPALFTLALYLFWRGFQRLGIGDWRLETDYRKLTTDYRTRSGRAATLLITDHRLLITFVTAGFLLGLAFYTYIPARGLWLLFPALLLMGGLWERSWMWGVWPGTLLMLLVAGLLAWPLFAYLQANPTAELRIDELSVPLTAVRQGDFSLLWANIKGGLAIFTVAGDTAWRYNIPERPLLGPIMGGLFYLGVGLALWQIFRGKGEVMGQSGRLAYAAAIIWLMGGLAPVLITGPELSMTQGMGMQPVVYLFVAVGIDRVWRVASGEWQVVGLVGVIVLFGGTAVITVRDYFGTWANAPEARVQYESTMTAALDYLAEQSITETAVSTITPGQFHTPALAQMVLPSNITEPRWFDGRGSLIVPNADEALLLFSGFAPLPQALEPYLEAPASSEAEAAVLQETLPLRPDDADRPIWVYRVSASEAVAAWQDWLTPHSAQFGEAATIVGYDLSAERVAAGETVQLITVWQVQQAAPDLLLFAHLVGTDGRPLAQADRLDAPSGSWVAGDWLVQLHEIVIPAETAVGVYPLTVGLYSCLDTACTQTERLTVWQDGTAVGDSLLLTEMSVAE
ncbi:ArnT family glycosyltransferase [Candidatus Leptofilum sp.]|uniref:ArnT family glycosyltransferase n=1 Tax=Candidatus Leptofilum sp. TaxID=3241576 RepID=UPI003B5C05C9